MKVKDLRPAGTGWQVHLPEKGGKEHKMPCHHALSEMLHAYVAASGIADYRKGWLFRTSPGHNATMLTEQPLINQPHGSWFAGGPVLPASPGRSAVTFRA